MTSLFYSPHDPEVGKKFNPEFDVEFNFKKNCVFRFFIFTTFVEREKTQPIANYGRTSLYNSKYIHPKENDLKNLNTMKIGR